MSDVNIRGLRELRKELKQFPDKIQKKAVRKSISSAAKVIQKRAKQTAPKKSGVLRRSIAVKSLRQRNRNIVRSIVFVRTGTRRTKAQIRKNQDAYYWYFQEYGYRAVGRKKKGLRVTRKIRNRSARRVPGRNFMSKAFKASSGRAIVTFKKQLAVEIEKYGSGV